MSKYFKKVAKDAGSLTGKAVKVAIIPVVSEVVAEIVKETGIVEEIKGQLVDLGIKAIKESGVDPMKLGREAIKSMIMKDIGSVTGTKHKK